MLYIATIALALATQPEVEVHPERQAQIDSVAKAGAKWVAKAHPRFASFRPGASMSLLGVKGDWAQDIREHIAKGLVTPFVPQNANMAIPESFDSATFWPQCSKSIGMIRDQSNCGEAPVCTPVSFLVHSTWCIRANAYDKSERLKMRLVPLYAGCCWAFAAAILDHSRRQRPLRSHMPCMSRLAARRSGCTRSGTRPYGCQAKPRRA
jgi:hypothetical protein